MNERLENAIERGGDQAKIFEEAADPNAAEKAAEEKAEETTEQPENLTPESPTEEAENASAAGFSAEEPAEQEGDRQHDGGGVLQPPAGEDPPLSGEGDRQHDGGNIYAEWQELAEAHPEVVGKELPEDILEAVMQSDLPPLRVYESMMLRKQNEQIAALQQEIATLRQNADNTARAPVVAAAEGPANEPEDLFMKGFNSY